MAEAAELVILQGYAVTDAQAVEQAIITQGYAAGEGGPVPVEGRLIVNQTGATVSG
jgi:hypothetical protein